MELPKKYLEMCKWFYPNLGVKRYFLLAILGLFLVAGGLSVISSGETLGFIEVQFREIIYQLAGKDTVMVGPAGVVTCLAGMAIVFIAFKKMISSIISVLIPENEERILDVIYSRRQLKRGPKIVVIGGGTGLSALLKGLKEYTSNLTAIVTVGDDGGSSGRLRRELGILPPGDIRNCLVALAEKEDIMEELFSYRFDTGTLAGHSLGNLFLAGLAGRFGDFQKGIEQIGKVFALRGEVYPSTLSQITLNAYFEDGRFINGETAIRTTPGKIKVLNIMPQDCRPLPGALAAIEDADLIVLGPGSLYTSIIPNLLVKGLRDKIASAKAPCIYVCNIMTEPGETDHYTVADHLKVIIEHGGKDLVDAVLAARENISQQVRERYQVEGAEVVDGDAAEAEKLGVRYFEGSFYTGGEVVRHNPDKLAKEILRLLFCLKPVNERVAMVDSYLLNRKIKSI
ncbi:gluconeogenesis factor YvcK family protein [Dehalobacter restrictus]|uniref:Putative gluconeogenesis factor n=1 Tax=Dehalobacter restrictus TaxID=55583 RepID=A0A857DMM4_9FIRM|nr:gluconeogenesis factor YvcK family protein [Dehalobacter restrictus]QHA01692.1 uridine diphosphate-N-acetylglucosamine-binding protein YvcK [Dehalobacter restrictus]